MNQYKIIACDLDGTLLNNKSEISPENLSAIKAFAGKGVYFVPSTGRGFSELPKELKDNPHIRYAICSNGAVVCDKQAGNVVTNCITNKEMQEILDILYSYDVHLTCRHNGKCFVDTAFHSAEHFEYYNVCIPHIRVMLNYGVCLDDFKEYCYKADGVEAISAIFHKSEEKNECAKRLKAFEGLQIAEIDEFSIEIFNVNAGKGNALLTLAEKLGIEQSQTVGMGDSTNDISLVKSAGLGLAMSNSDDALKEVADMIICSNEEHSVDYVLKNFV